MNRLPPPGVGGNNADARACGRPAMAPAGARASVDVWMAELDVWALVGTVLHHGTRRVRLRATRVTVGARRLERWIGPMLGLRPAEQFNVDLAVLDERGRGLSGRFEARLNRLAGALVPDGAIEDWLPPEQRPVATIWQRLIRAVLIAYSREPLILPTYVECAYRTGRVSSADVSHVECHIPFPVLGRWVARMFPFEPGPPGRLRTRWSLRGMAEAIRFVPGRPPYWLRASFGRLAQSTADVSPDAIRKGVIFQQNVGSMYELYPAGGHLFWYEGSGIDPARVVIYADRSDAPMDAEARAAASERGFGWVDAAEPLAFLDRPLRTALVSLWRARGALRRRGVVGWWCFATLTRHMVLVEAYRGMFRRFNVKALYQSLVFVSGTLSAQIALRQEQGVFLWNFWSMHQFPVAQHHCGAADVVFAWGPYHRGYYLVHDLAFRWMFDVGVIMGDGKTEGDMEKATQWRRAFAPTVRFVVTVLDTSASPVSHNSPEHILRFYDCVLRLVHRHPDWGCIIKRKKRIDDVPPRGSGLQAIVADLEREGRCLILPAQERVSVAALAGDLAACASVNTAGCQSAIAGRPAVHLDLGGLIWHPFSVGGGDDRIIFRSENAFSSAIEKAAAGENSIGDHGPWLDMIDPFRDGRGRQRVGEVLRHYLVGLDAGEDRDTSMDRAAAAFGERHGQQHVFRPGKKAEHEADRLWRRTYALSSEDQ